MFSNDLLNGCCFELGRNYNRNPIFRKQRDIDVFVTKDWLAFVVDCDLDRQR
jgi:hypothetical protein